MRKKIACIGLTVVFSLSSIFSSAIGLASVVLPVKPSSTQINISSDTELFGFYDNKIPGNYSSCSWSEVSSETESKVYNDVTKLNETLTKRMEEINGLDCVPQSYSNSKETGILNYRQDMHRCITGLKNRIYYGCDNMSFQLYLIAHESSDGKKVIASDYMSRLSNIIVYIDKGYCYYEPVSGNIGTVTTEDNMNSLIQSWRELLQGVYTDCTTGKVNATQEEISGVLSDHRSFGTVTDLVSYGGSAVKDVHSSVTSIVVNNGGTLPTSTLVPVNTSTPKVVVTDIPRQTEQVIVTIKPVETESVIVTMRPTEVPVIQRPTEVPATQKPTEVPVTRKPTEVPVISEPTITPGITIINNTETPGGPTIVIQSPKPTATAKVIVVKQTEKPKATKKPPVKKTTKTVKNISCSKKKVTLGRGESFKLSVKNIAGRPIIYTSSNGCAAVSSKGVVTAKSVGSAKIYIVCGGKKLTVVINVKKAPSSAKFKLKKLVLRKDFTKHLKVVLSKGSASNKVIWKSSNPNVASVSKGKITAKNNGAAVITATTYNGKGCKLQVIVK